MNKQVQIWSGLLLILGSGVLLFFASEYSGKNWAFVFGESSVYALMFAGLAAAILASTRAKKAIETALLVGIACLGVAVWQSLDMLSTAREQQTLARDLTAGIDKVIAQREEIAAPQSARSSDAQSLIKQLMDAAYERELRGAKALEDARMDTMLAPSTMLDPKQAAAARMRLATLKKENAAICREAIASMSDFEESLQNSSDPSSAEMLGGFRETKQAGIDRTNAMCALEDEIALTVDRLLEITTNNVDRISVSAEGQMLFQDEATLLIYNNSFAKFSELAKQEERMTNENLALMKSNRNKMAKLAHIEEHP